MSKKKIANPPSVKVQPYDSMEELWKDVCSGNLDYREFKQTHHERRFLQALHSDRALALMAKEISNGCRPVTVASAFIDAKPRFKWEGGAGEIADLLVIVNRTDHKEQRGLACLVQAKVSTVSDSLSDGDSTEQQLALYQSWPDIAFKSKTDLAVLKESIPPMQYEFALNHEGGKWPFPFLRICNIATPNNSVPPSPLWTTEGEPFTVMGSVPEQSPTTLTKWLHTAGDFHKPDAMEVIDGKDCNPTFRSLVHSLLAVLASRGKNGKFGYSGGQLFNEFNLNLTFDHVQQFIPENRAFTAVKNDFSFDKGTGEISPDDDAFLVIYVEVGPESFHSQEVKYPPAFNYPGIDLLP